MLLEGSVALAGALVQWLRDNLGLIAASDGIEALARTVEDNGGVYFVPAFSGLYAPYWKDSARGVIAGLTRYANKGHLARAVLEATAFRTPRDVLEAMEQDSGIHLATLRADGGMVANELLMQFQADMLSRPVVRPVMRETTALGAAYAAGFVDHRRLRVPGPPRSEACSRRLDMRGPGSRSKPHSGHWLLTFRISLLGKNGCHVNYRPVSGSY